MSTKRLGYGITAVGVTGALVSVLVDFVGLGDGRIQAAQIAGILVGILLSVFGLSVARFVPDQPFDIGNRLKSGWIRMLNLPVGVWFMIGFVIAYVCLFVYPVFFNDSRRIEYFYRFLPDKFPIGLDMNFTLKYVKAWVTTGVSPYPDSHYPPLTYILLSPLLLFSYPTSYFVTTFLTIVSYLLATMLLPILFTPKKDTSLVVLLSVTGLFSYGFLFELERGQYYTMAFLLALVSIYLFHQHYEFRFLAYMLFSFSVHLKIVPIFFIPMFIRDWHDWKKNIRRMVGLSLFNVMLLFSLGYKNLMAFIDALMSRVEAPTFLWNGNHSLANFVFNFVIDGYGLLSENTLNFLQKNAAWFERLLLLIVALCVLSIIVHLYRNKKVGFNPYLLLVCTLSALIVPVSVDYTLPMLVAPLAIFLVSERNLRWGTWNRLASIVLILAIAISYASLLYPFKYKPLFLNNSFPALFVILVAVALYYFLQGRHKETLVGDNTVVE